MTPDSSDPDPETLVSFRALALDILSGRPKPQGAAAREESFEVWADPTDASATVAVRFFEGGQVVSMAAMSPNSMQERAKFRAAVARLARALERTAPTAQEARQSQCGLKLLTPCAAAERLGRALGVYAAQGGSTFEPGVLGDPTDETRAYLTALHALDHDRKALTSGKPMLH